MLWWPDWRACSGKKVLNKLGKRQKVKKKLFKFLQRPGIEPGTSAVLKPRHNQLDHLCVMVGVARALRIQKV